MRLAERAHLNILRQIYKMRDPETMRRPSEKKTSVGVAESLVCATHRTLQDSPIQLASSNVSEKRKVHSLATICGSTSLSRYGHSQPGEDLGLPYP